MPRRLELLDTSIVLELLRVPYESDRHEDTVAQLDRRTNRGVQFQLPVAAVVEAGAHIGRIANGHHRRGCAEGFHRMMTKTLQRTLPWSFTSLQWDEAFIKELMDPTDPRLSPLAEYVANQQLKTGDALIVGEFRRLRRNLDRRVVDIDVWTYDAGLRAVVDALRR